MLYSGKLLGGCELNSANAELRGWYLNAFLERRLAILLQTEGVDKISLEWASGLFYFSSASSLNWY